MINSFENIEKNNYLNSINCDISYGKILGALNHEKFINKKILGGEKSIEILIDNLTYISSTILKYQKGGKKTLKKEELFLLENFEEIHKKILDVAKNVTTDLFQDLLGKNFKIDRGLSFIDSFGKIPFLNENLYNIQSFKPGKEILLNIYVLAVNYIISYYRWLNKPGKEFVCNMDKCFNKDLEKLAITLGSKIKGFEGNNNILKQICMLLGTNLNINSFKQIVDNIEEGRIKSFESSIKKLLKASKARDEFYENGILGDQIGFSAEFKSKYKLREIALEILKIFKNGGDIYKFNDRGVIKVSSDNKETIKDMVSFVNIGFKDDNGLIGEISLRYNEDKIINSIIEKYKENNNIGIFVKALITKVDYLNHDIYKLSQDIKIIRNFINVGIIKKYTNFENTSIKYIQKKVSKITKHIVNEIEKLEPNIKNINIYGIIEYIIYEMLEKRLKEVTYDLTWEDIVNNIKETDSYKKNKNKKKYLKRLKIKFIKKHLNNTSTDSLSNYSKEIKKIYMEFKREYKKVFKDSIFYQTCKKLKKTSKIKNEINYQASCSLVKTFLR